MSGIGRITIERSRQIDKGFTRDRDDGYTKSEMIDAARCYLVAAMYAMTGRAMQAWSRDQAAYWPWAEEHWKPSVDPIRNLEKAGALIAAEIDRRERLAP